jgi:hypothetical protein
MFTIKVEKDDIVVMSSDGLVDNLVCPIRQRCFLACSHKLTMWMVPVLPTPVRRRHPGRPRRFRSSLIRLTFPSPQLGGQLPPLFAHRVPTTLLASKGV